MRKKTNEAFALDRRAFLAAAGASLAAPALSSRAGAVVPRGEWATPHGLSMFGELAEKPGFAAFPYVRADAPKGGTIAQESYGAFNSLNPFILKGDSPSSMWLTFDSLMSGSLDERDAMYPLVAESVSIAPDKSALLFRLRKAARFNDGSPLTAKDVVFSLNVLKEKGHPIIRQSLRDMTSATAEDDATVLVRLAPGRSRDLPLIVARQPIFSAAYYATRAFDESSLEPPLGSGPYRVGKFESGRFVTFERVPDYWGRDLPVNVGQNNFDLIRYDYFSDRPVAFEAFKAGAFTVREEFTAANWATGYDFPAFREKRVIRREIPDYNISGVQGWFFNTRRRHLKDIALREAIGLAFDFKWTNANLMYGAYMRTQSYFENSDMKAKGVAQGKERALLETYRGRVPDEVFGEPYVPPESDGSGQDRAMLRQAMHLLLSAGYVRDGAALKDRDGRLVELEFLDFSTALERHTQPFIKNLKLLGIDARMRIVDAAQYRRRLDDFDFDIITQRLTMAYSPGEELRNLFGSESAGIRGSRNMVGVADPVVDDLIARALVATTREDLIVICRALDRVLRAGRYWTPHWYKATHWMAHWDCFGWPERMPKYDPGVLTTWWWDQARAKAIGFQGR